MGTKRPPRRDPPFTVTQRFVVLVSIGVVGLWCVSGSLLRHVTGQMGVLGIIPFVLFFSTGVLSREDLNNFLWSVVLLAMGGLVLGESIKSSGLLDVIAGGLGSLIEEHRLGLWTSMMLFNLFVLICTTFVSHTVGAIIVVPIVHAVGSQMVPVPHVNELVLGAALCCSVAMGLPVSGFPNMTAVNIEDALGNRFLRTRDFLMVALPASAMSFVLIGTVGYTLIVWTIRYVH
jgi:di/tricarboxylate transporter